MNIMEINKETFYTRDVISKISRKDIEFLERKAAGNLRKRARLCLHQDPEDSLHEMLVVFPKGAYARPHKHIRKSESLHVIKGTFKVVIFDETGKIVEVINMGDYSRGDSFYYRLSESCFHTVIPTSDFTVYHETTNGPFQREDTVFAAWAPAEDEFEKQQLYLKELAARLQHGDFHRRKNAYCRTPLKGQAALRYVEKRLGFALKTLLVFPKFFLIETTNICNARCIMCGIDFDKKKKAVMSDALFNKITGEIADYRDHVEKVMLYLDCEPLLDKKLSSRIQQMKQNGIRKVNIATNASLLNSSKAEELIKAGLDEIYITLDSLNKDVFEAIRPGLNFETVYKNIVDFIRLRNELNPGLTIRLQMVEQDLNHREVDVFVRHWVQLLGPDDQVVVQKAHNWGSAVKVKQFGDEDAVNDIPCIALWGTLCIHVDGQVGLCCMDTETTIPIGNVVSQSIAEIWSGRPLERMRKIHISGSRTKIALCDGCTVWRESKHQREKIKRAD